MAQDIFTYSKPFFELKWINARPLTTEDVIVKIDIMSTEEVLSSINRGGGYYNFLATIFVTLKPHVIDELNKVGYFQYLNNTVDYESLSKKDQNLYSKFYEHLHFPVDLKTEKGGRVRAKNVINQIVDEARTKTVEGVESQKEAVIQTLIDEFNAKIKRHIFTHNNHVKNTLIGVMTVRKNFDGLLDYNKENEEIKLVKAMHDDKVQTVDAKIAELNQQIKELEEQKTELYVEASSCVFDFGLIPDELKEDIIRLYEERKVFKKEGMFGFM